MSDDVTGGDAAISWDTVLEQVGERNTGVPVPPEVLERLGGGKRPKLVVTVNGFEYRNAVGSMGGRALISFSVDKRKATGLAGGDPIRVTARLDSEPQTLDLPDDLVAALDEAGVRAAFDALAPSHRKEHVRAVTEAKKPETRQRRIAAVVDKLA